MNINACKHDITKHLNITTGNHQSVQAYELEGIKASGIVIIKAGRHWSIQSLKQVKIEAYEHQSI